MRNLLIISLDTAKANDSARAGTLAQTIGGIVDDQKPESVYFTEIDGVRTGIMVVDIETAMDIPRIAEPWFLAFDAKVEFHPTMVPADLEAAGPSIEAAVKAYG
ncbi:MAG: hypothetical protein EDR02_13080 [Actinobacteria bacterium]|nr:MAG: hypothetical protein EDR02_13080 [Actinomycetota bacterium]RIK04574.1 MAG: hypothetical protein DCC48_12745 [Acidobacteriota bacterium]